jgi:hypothetical protein
MQMNIRLSFLRPYTNLHHENHPKMLTRSKQKHSTAGGPSAETSASWGTTPTTDTIPPPSSAGPGACTGGWDQIPDCGLKRGFDTPGSGGDSLAFQQKIPGLDMQPQPRLKVQLLTTMLATMLQLQRATV